jgi:hypothetical protein
VCGSAGYATASYLVRNDVTGYRGFAATLAASLKTVGRGRAGCG